MRLAADDHDQAVQHFERALFHMYETLPQQEYPQHPIVRRPLLLSQFW